MYLLILMIFLCFPKIVQAESIHGNYSANTDACSVCHTRIHNSPGQHLLNWDSSGPEGLTIVCMACHDGTQATYDVKSGTYVATDTGETKQCNGGLFALENNSQADSGSQHDVFTGLKMGAAPGGSSLEIPDSNGQWAGNFDCVSCHDPHGAGGNARLLKPNPNWVQSAGLNPLEYPGKMKVNLGITDGRLIYDWPKDNSDIPMLYYPYSDTTQVYAVLNDQIVARAKITNDNGLKLTFSSLPPVGAQIFANYTPQLQVKMNIVDKYKSTEKVTYLSGINAFCSSCHTDYDTSGIPITNSTSSGKTPNGKYSLKTRHPVGMLSNKRELVESRQLTLEGNEPDQGIVTCLTCHFAHGVDKENTWQEQSKQSGINEYYYSQVQGSSNLKRLPNMAVCEPCHQGKLLGY